jgi:hypothetical protein
MLLIDRESLPSLSNADHEIRAELVDNDIRVTVQTGRAERSQILEIPLSNADHTAWLAKEGLVVRGVAPLASGDAAKRIADYFCSTQVHRS